MCRGTQRGYSRSRSRPGEPKLRATPLTTTETTNSASPFRPQEPQLTYLHQMKTRDFYWVPEIGPLSYLTVLFLADWLPADDMYRVKRATGKGVTNGHEKTPMHWGPGRHGALFAPPGPLDKVQPLAFRASRR